MTAAHESAPYAPGRVMDLLRDGAASEPRLYEFKRWSGRIEQVRAERVEFTAGGGLAFWDADRLLLAVPQGDWHDLREVDAFEGLADGS